MAETKLVLTFGVSGGGETTMTLSDAKASMSIIKSIIFDQIFYLGIYHR